MIAKFDALLLRVVVVGRLSPQRVQSALQRCLCDVGHVIQTMPQHTFNNMAEELASELRACDEEDVAGASTRVHSEVMRHRFDFKRHHRLAGLVTEFNGEHLLSFFSHFVAPDSPARAALATHIIGRDALEELHGGGHCRELFHGGRAMLIFYPPDAQPFADDTIPEGKEDGVDMNVASFKEDVDVLDRRVNYAWDLPGSPSLARAGSFREKVKTQSSFKLS